MDTKVMENTAEDLIAHKLQRSGILVAKPKFDQEGADLIALLDVSDGAKFCRIQCKGRSMVRSEHASVEVPKRYVTDGFLLFIFVETGDKEATHLFCFFGRDIRDVWRSRDKDEQYVLSLSSKRLEELGPYRFIDSKIDEIKKTIVNVDVEGEFRHVLREYLGHDLDLKQSVKQLLEPPESGD